MFHQRQSTGDFASQMVASAKVQEMYLSLRSKAPKYKSFSFGGGQVAQLSGPTSKIYLGCKNKIFSNRWIVPQERNSFEEGTGRALRVEKNLL